MIIRKINILGIPLVQWLHGGCTANFGVNEEEKWATLYDILSRNEGNGEATYLLKQAKEFYEGLGYKFGGSVALNERMRKIYQRLNIEEYTI